MCGITGIVDFDGGRDGDLQLAVEMARLLEHRGPDDSGSFTEPGVALAHRRLAILDLSSDGRQPMADASGRYQLVYNGEIYNYRELRAELEARRHRFRTATDTEVVVEAYAEWGPACVEHFNGMWALAVWDRHERELFCSRDRYGIKPFYYRCAGRRLVFASELKAFRADPAPLAPNPRAVRAYLEHGLLDHTDETLFAGILQLPPAHSMVFDRDGGHLTRHWSLQPRDFGGDAGDEVRSLFIDAVRLQLRSDVPIGSCLSGGIDSSAIVGAVDHLLRTEAESAKPVGREQRTFTSYFTDPELDERPYARAVVDQSRAAAHWISFTDDDLQRDLAAIVEAHDEPFRSTSMIAQWYVMREARAAGIKVMLDGQGADELLAGYRSFFAFFFVDRLRSGRVRQLASEVTAFRRFTGFGRARTVAAVARPFIPDALAWRARSHRNGSAGLLHPELRAHRPVLPVGPRTYPDRLRSQLHLVLERRLPELLHAEDRNSMAHSLEARVPFLDHRLVELLFSLDASHMIQDGRTKAVLRRALADLLPPVVAARVDKIGFATPEARWFRGNLGLLALDVFGSREFKERGFVDAPAARRRLELHRRGELQAGSELWRALNLELWARSFVDGAR